MHQLAEGCNAVCGIFGHFMLFDADPALVEEMGQRLIHRGPDGIGVFRDKFLSFGATRLAIIDLSAPAGPIFNEDGRIGVALNGEIYNYRDLRQQLEAAGHQFSTATDTEVIVHAYEQWGDCFLEHLRGMFAFCLYDSVTCRIMLVRDRLGEKPLYYAWTSSGGLLFASEPKALLAHSAMRRAVRTEAITSFLILGYVPAPHTLYDGIEKLAPGEVLTVTPHGRDVRSYWHGPTDVGASLSYRDSVKRVRAALDEAVSLEMVSDVPVGAFLSGGVDSSAVVALMSQMRSTPIRTFTVGFDFEPGSSEDVKFNLDARYARDVAALYKADHETIYLPTDERLSQLLPALVYFMDDPIVMPTIVQSVFVAALARKAGIPVLLSGEGGDELFLGYNHFRLDLMVSRYKRLPNVLRQYVLDPLGQALPARGASVRKLQAKARLEEGLPRFLSWMQVVAPNRVPELLNDSTAAQCGLSGLERTVAPLLKHPTTRHFTDRLAYAGLRLQLAENHNMRVDRMSMAMSIEARAPFEDYRLAEFALRLPLEYKLRRGDFKVVLKDAIADLVPPAILNRPKWGFNPPASNWLRTGLRPLLLNTLSRERVEAVGVFQPDAIQRAIHAHIDEHQYELWPLWSALIFHLWHQIFIEGDGGNRPDLSPDSLTQIARIG